MSSLFPTKDLPRSLVSLSASTAECSHPLDATIFR